VVLAADGQKLSKQTGAQPIDLSEPVRALNAALLHLGLTPIEAVSVAEFWPRAIEKWAHGPWMRDSCYR
jgi:glutamyl-Q tRNA(Asp) synthetase